MTNHYSGQHLYCLLELQLAAFVALIPVAPGGWVVADLDVGLLAVFAVIGFFPIITILSAWSANSKFPFIGGIRALHQMVSFEIPLILSLPWSCNLNWNVKP